MFDMVPSLAVRLRLCADAAGCPEEHTAYAKATVLESAIASRSPTAIAQAYAEAEAVYSQLQTGTA